MRFHLVRRAVVLTGAGALALAGAIVPASGAAAPPWRVVKTFGPATGGWAETFTTTSAANSWSTWLACGAGSCGTPGGTLYYVEHSAGNAWNQVRVPAPLAGRAEASVATGASSFRNMWLIDKPAYKARTARVLRWNGSKWHIQAIPAWAVHGNLSGATAITAAVFGPKSVWIFSMGVDSFTNPDRYVARYNGHRWTKLQMPGVPGEVSVLSQDDIWALGYKVAPKGKYTEILMHWNGRGWHTIALPQAGVPAHATEFVNDPVALGPADVWIQRFIERGTAAATTMDLLHWNGRSWSRVALPAHVRFVDYMTQDGHGGLWLGVNGPKPYIYHLNGKWTKYGVPIIKGTTLLDLTGLSWIPGTRSVWATANLLQSGKNGGIIGAILKHSG